jgi:tetratricopeptide (TPR) repeat protein
MATEKTLLQQAQELNEKGEYQAVIDLLPDAVLQAENSADLYAEKAQAYWRLNKSELCGEMADKALAIHADNAKANRYKGIIYSELKEYDKAIVYFKRAIAKNPTSEYAYNGLGYVYADINKNDEAIKCYKKAIELNPKFDLPYNNLGRIYLGRKEYDAAIELFDKTIEVNKLYNHPYYNRAIVYEAWDENAKALANYEQYIKLTKDKEDYFAKRALEKVAKLKKAIKNVQYSNIADMVTQIKGLLLFTDGCITHYTGLSTAKALVLNGSLFRLSEGAFLNDTSEGRELFTYLNFHAKAHKSHDMEAITFSPKPFIGSFVADTKYDDLTLWRMYGKEQREEGKGCAITIQPALFAEAIQSKVTPPGGAANLPKMINDFLFYRVAYKLPNGDFVLPSFEGDPKEKELNETLQKLAAKVKEVSEHPDTTPEDKQDIMVLLNEIAYLFKTAEYQHEQEVRLVLDGVGFDKLFYIDATPPRVYIELVDIRPLIQKITIGPKVERGDEWAAAFYYSLDKDKLHPEICISHLPYK